ncbi:DUF3383 domain-containing protein [Chromobacterium subtsugae]|uniref:DUF3383 domain-containing protein n=1 Tax=Chromobacterium subtsugae TaxID=251747 RepID=UPI00064111C9|nr:DUF3383 domain-containing protein [Chromobacterium subtsugae]
MATNTLSVSDVVNVQIVMSPIAAAVRNFGAMLIVGSSPVIDTTERIRSYSGLTGVAGDYSMTSPEYQAAALYFGQTPQPSLLYLGRWAQTATSGILHGAALSAASQALVNFTAVAAGGMSVSVDGKVQALAGINLNGATNLNGVAALITAALTGAVCTWNPSFSRFDITSASSGTKSVVLFASAPAAGTDISALLGLNAGQGGTQVAGVAAESLASAVATLAQNSGWYGLSVAAAGVQPSDHLAVSAFIEGASPSRVYGITSQDPACMDPTQTSDIASQMQALGYNRTCVQYSSSSAYAVCSLMGRAFTVDFTANRSTITLKFKGEPGVAAESLNETQAATLKAKNCNVLAPYNNNTVIIQEGVMSGGWFFDERQGLDWLQNATQTAAWNVLYGSQTKIPQTDEGVNQIVAGIEHDAMEPAINNGLFAPGLWTGPAIGALQPNQALTKGYYIYAPPVASQSAADRAARKAPTLQIAGKLAGAIHSINVIINVNR